MTSRGVDVAQLVSVAQWRQFIDEGFHFAIVRCFRNKAPGIFDDSCPTTIANAIAARITEIDVYHYPYLGKPAVDQAKATVAFLQAHGIRPGRIFLDVEQTDTPWTTPPQNLAFIRDFVKGVGAYAQVGIYTGTEDWKHFTNNNTEFSSLPLWWSSHGKAYVKFGGWDAPSLVQSRYDQKLGGVDYDLDEKPAPAMAAMTAAQLTKELLESYLDKHISQICGNGFTSDADNHCAHFVNHVLGNGFGMVCGHAKPPANLRVHETFAKCGRVGTWASRPPDLAPCFAFVTETNAVHLDEKVMDNIPRKHIGIFLDGEVFHYSNALRHVIRQSPVDFAKHFPGAGFSMFYGELPT